MVLYHNCKIITIKQAKVSRALLASSLLAFEVKGSIWASMVTILRKI